jgi:hypothetical protein
MAREKRPPRKSIRPYYFIVEGFTEENYLCLLKQLFKRSAIIKNCKGGSANNVLSEAQKNINKSNSDDYSGYIIWFDQDTFISSDANLKNSMESIRGVTIYMSQPCVENWLLAHFQPINLNEYECSACEKKLLKYIPNYDKNDPDLLKKVITEKEIQVAIANYPELGKIRTEYFGKIVS